MSSSYNAHETALVHVRPGADVLVLGAGAGTTVEQLCALGCTVTAADTDEVVGGPTVDRVLVDLNQPDPLRLLAGRTFDQVLLLDALDHTWDPVGTLSQLAKLLTSGGSLVLNLRNASHLDVRLSLLEEQVTGSTGPARLWTRDAAVQAVADAGLETLDVVPVRRDGRGAAVASGRPVELVELLADVEDSDVEQFVLLAATGVVEPLGSVLRRFHDDSVERAAALDAAAEYARTLEQRVADVERVLELERAESALLEREAEELRRTAAAAAGRADQVEQQFRELEGHYRALETHVQGVDAARAAAEHRLAEVTGRTAYRAMDRAVRRLARYPRTFRALGAAGRRVVRRSAP